MTPTKRRPLRPGGVRASRRRDSSPARRPSSASASLPAAELEAGQQTSLAEPPNRHGDRLCRQKQPTTKPTSSPTQTLVHVLSLSFKKRLAIAAAYLEATAAASSAERADVKDGVHPPSLGHRDRHIRTARQVVITHSNDDHKPTIDSIFTQ